METKAIEDVGMFLILPNAEYDEDSRIGLEENIDLVAEWVVLLDDNKNYIDRRPVRHHVFRLLRQFLSIQMFQGGDLGAC